MSSVASGHPAQPENGWDTPAHKMVDRKLPLPAWAQVAQDLRRTISLDRALGDKLPPEVTLAEQYGVSRITVRQALGQLEDEGLVERQQGRGTFVTATDGHVIHDLTLVEPWKQRFAAGGHAAASEQVACDDDSFLPPELRALLRGVALGERPHHVRRRHLVDDRPIGVVDSWVPEAVAPGLCDQPLLDGSLSATLTLRYGLRFGASDSTLTVGELTADEADVLETVAGLPVVVVHEVLRDNNREVLAVSSTRWLAHRVRFRFAGAY